jgi:hypothetical protein
MASAGDLAKHFHAIAAAHADYAKRSFKEGAAFFEKLASAKSLQENGLRNIRRGVEENHRDVQRTLQDRAEAIWRHESRKRPKRPINNASTSRQTTKIGKLAELFAWKHACRRGAFVRI